MLYGDSYPKNKPLTRTVINCFTRVVTAVRAIVSQVTFTELGLHTHTVTRTIVEFCTYGLATVNTTETIEASVGTFFLCQLLL